VTVTADRLIAWYRHKGETTPAHQVATGQTGAGPGQTETGQQPPAGLTGSADTEGNEVYRLRAEGNVHVFTLTDQAWGDQATDDLDQAVLVMTGNNLKLTTPNDTLTARDTLEYWSRQHMAVARGDAVILTNDARRISADTLVAYTVEAPAAGSAGAASNAPARNAAGPANPSGDPMAAMAGRLERVEAFGNVSIRTVTDSVIGDRGVYVPDTGVAHLGGNVRITRGMNQINGAEAVVNMKTGVATLLAGDSGRVTGLMMPNDQSNPPADTGAKSKQPGDQPKPGAKP
jgi:lipopolysaccharide export system protein LptA